jgi:hypothetical protein
MSCVYLRHALSILAVVAFAAASPAYAQCTDHDSDGYQPSPADPNCALPAGDCLDDHPGINPGASETCGDLLDNNCDGNTDEGFLVGTESGLPPNPADPNARYDCNDGVDNDGDGDADLDDPDCQAAQCHLTDPPGCCAGDDQPPGQQCTGLDPGGCCLTLAFLQCDPQSPASPTICAEPAGGRLLQLPEGGIGDASCGDAKDNDCDGLVDLAEPQCQAAEICNGLGIDNDGDGDIDIDDAGCVAGIDDDPNFTLGQIPLGGSCVAGTGDCSRTGTVICDSGGGVICSRAPGPPGTEGPPGSNSCFDSADNDCDGATDFPGDSDCTSAEVCDGLDNDGDGQVDETFTDLGDTCFNGQGACQSPGTRICASAGNGTVCDAIPGLASQEGPSGSTCIDQIDNDCDGMIDTDDPDCGSAGLAITCSLTQIRGAFGNDCSELHKINIRITGETGVDTAIVTAELLGLDFEGNVLASLPVRNGDEARLASRVNPRSFRASTREFTPRSRRPGGRERPPRADRRHRMFAPVPLLRVNVRDGLSEATAYCSHVPYLQVVTPDEQVQTAGNGGKTHVMAAMPRIDPDSLSILVDGEDVLSQIVSGPDLFCPRVAPCSGTALVGNQLVQITDLVVDSRRVGQLSTNTLSMDVSDLGCGAHTIAVLGDERADAFPLTPSPRCVQDDMLDSGEWAVFEIDITSPTAGSGNNPAPTPVQGEICHGRPIAAAKINGKALDPNGQVATVLDPNTPSERTTWRLPINTSLGRTDLARDLKFGDVAMGTFDAGSNRVIADAEDDQGNRAFETVIFATGNTANPGLPAAALRPPPGGISAAADGVAGTRLGTSGRKTMGRYSPAIPSADLEFDFPDGVPGEADPAVIEQWERALEEAFQGEYDADLKAAYDESFGQILPELATPGVEIPNAFVVGIKANAIREVFEAKCARAAVQFRDRVRSRILAKPPKSKQIGVPCSCDPWITIWTSSVSINANDFTCPVTFTNDKFSVQINLPDVRIFTGVSGSCQTSFLGACIARTVVTGSVETRLNNVTMQFSVTESQLMGNPNPTVPLFAPGAALNIDAGASVDIQCIGGDICEGLVTVFTLGLVDISPDIDVSNDIDFNREVGSGKPDPIELDEVKVDEATVMQFDQEAEGRLSSVDISPQGIIAGLKGKFKTSMVDPSVVSTPGAVVTANNVLPSPLAPGTGDVFLAISDDVFNQLFASMRIAGKLNSGCRTTNKTVGDLLPFDCTNLNAASPGGTAAVQGLCHGIRGDDCELFDGPDLFKTPILQGICHGTQGANCTGIPRGLMGTAYPSDCESMTFSVPGADPNGGSGPDQATAILQGVCHGLAGDDCELLAGADDSLTAMEQGACHAALGTPCQTLPASLLTGGREKGTCEAVSGSQCSLLPLTQRLSCLPAKVIAEAADALLDFEERKACEVTPARNVNIAAVDPLLFCTTTDMPPRLLIQDDFSTPEVVETGIRLNDLSVAMLVDRNAATSPGLDGALPATPGCFDPGAPTTGDCLIFGVCLDLNFVTDMRFDNQICAAGKPGLKTQVKNLQTTVRQEGVVCGAPTATADDLLTSAGATSNTMDILMQNVDMFTPPSCANGFDLSENLSYGPATFKLVAIETDPGSDPGNTLQEYIAITGLIAP